MVAPLRFGAGVKGKIVEALYYGLPVITTNIGVEGLPVDNPIIVAETEKDFATAISGLYNDLTRLKSVAAEAQAFVGREFSEDAAKKIVEAIFS